MVDFVGLMSGFNEQEKTNNQSRRDMAKAFADFKAANPYASAAEFQSFIDSYSGGRNYIAGGAPGSEILSALGKSNNERRVKDEMRTRISDAKAQSSFVDDLRSQANTFLTSLSGDPTTIDFTKAYKDFVGTMGINEQEANDIFGGNGLTMFFSEGNYRDIQRAEMAKNLPNLMGQIKAAGGKVTDDNFKKMAKQAGIPEFMVEDAMKLYRTDKITADNKAKFVNRGELIIRAREAIDRGETNVAKIIQGDAQALGLTIDENDPYWKEITAAATQTKNKADATWKMTNRKDLMNEAQSLIANGQGDMVLPHIQGLARDAGLTIDPNDQWWQDIKAEAVRMRSIEDTNIENAKQDRLADNNDAFYSRLQSDTTITSLIDRGEIEKAKAAITARANKFQPEVRDFLTAGIDEFLSSTVAERVLAQNAQLAENRDQARGARTSAETAYSTTNQGKVTQFFGSIDESNPNAGPAKGNAVLAASEIAKVFDMNMATMSVLQNAWSQVPEETSAQELVALGQKALTDSRLGVSAADGKSKAGDLAEQNSGFLGMSQTFDNWLTGLDGKTRDQFGAIENKFLALSRLPSSTAEEAQKKIALLNALQTRIMNTTGAVSTYIQSAQDTSFGPDGWITKGTPQWNVAEISGENGFKDKVAKMQKELTDKIAEEVNNTTVPNAPTPPVGGGGNQNASNAASSFSRYWEELGNRGDRRSELYSKLQDAGFRDTSGTMDTMGQLSGMFGSFTDQQLEDNQLVYDYLVSAGNETMILDSAEEYGKFLADPAGYVKARNASVGSN